MSDNQLLPELNRDQIEAVAEIRVLAGILAAKYKEYVDFFVKEYKLSPAAALEKAEETHEHYIERMLSEHPSQTSWFFLGDLQNQDPELAIKRWEEVKEAAKDEILSGSYAAEILNEGPFERAKFLAIRHAFKQQWQPTNEGEQLLVDMLAQLYVSYLDWLKILQVRVGIESERERFQIEKNGKWDQPQVSTAEAIEEAGIMVDRFNRLFLRTLRALRDLRRWAGNINITNPKQVNIGAQQVNTSSSKEAG